LKNLYIFRHGQTAWNAEHRMQGQIALPIPLTEQGMEDAKSIAPLLINKNIELIISSDLLRAKQTAETVASALKLPLEFDSRLRETNFGDAQGMLLSETSQKFPDLEHAMKVNHDKILANSGETINQVKGRMRNFLTDTCLNRKENNIAVSSHGSIIGNYVSTLNGGTYLPMHNAAIVHVIYDEKAKTFIYNGLLENKDNKAGELCF